LIAKEEFLKKYNISEDLFRSAEMTWEDLCDIYEDFHGNKHNKYEGILKDFTETYLEDMNKGREDGEERIKVHSIHSRVKDPEHLIAKIIRKKQENQNKYRKLNKMNYEKFITDLIGIRCLILFKADWKSFHKYIISQFENEADCYIKDSLRDFDDDENHFYIAEKPKVHIRNGDARDIYDELLPPACILDGKVYRSVHYIIKYKGVYLEIQVRTLFEEGWGEVDHAVIYPYFQNDQVLKEYTELLNRLSGLADEMGSFFCRLKEMETGNNNSPSDAHEKQETLDETKKTGPDHHTSIPVRKQSINTLNDCLQSVLNE